MLNHVVGGLERSNGNRLLCNQNGHGAGYSPLIGSSPPMRDLCEKIAKVSQGDYPVMLVGETGTGKELVARCIHQTGPRADRPFTPVDCGALVPTLIESELFGYVRGAFTGAVCNKKGLFEAAGSGTVFIDEINELPVDLQAKLLRALEEKEIRRVGSVNRTEINARVLAASIHDLESAVHLGGFRKDLYYRLSVVTLPLPPLRERKSDIPLLVNHYLEKLQKPGQPRLILSEGAMECLMAHDWPGNVRELRNCIERATALASGPVLKCADLSIYPEDSRIPSLNGSPFEKPNSFLPLRELERQYILRALADMGGNKLLAAQRLGIGKTTLYRKLKTYRTA